MVKNAEVIVYEDAAEAVDTTLSFEDHVSKFRNSIEKNRKRSIKTIWEIGAFVSLLKQEKVYGDKTVESFIDAMDDTAVSKAEVYKWANFAERYTLDQVNSLLKRKNMGWGVIANLIRVKDVGTRTLLEEKVDNGELPPSKVQEVVSSLNQRLASSDEGDDKKGKDKKPVSVNTCRSNFKKVNIFLEKVLTNKDSCIKDIQDLSAILDDEKMYEKAVDVMEDFKVLAGRVKDTLEELTEALDKTI